MTLVICYFKIYFFICNIFLIFIIVLFLLFLLFLLFIIFVFFYFYYFNIFIIFFIFLLFFGSSQFSARSSQLAVFSSQTPHIRKRKPQTAIPNTVTPQEKVANTEILCRKIIDERPLRALYNRSRLLKVYKASMYQMSLYVIWLLW